MRITIRMDDITPDMDHAKFKRFKELLDEHDIKPLIGVVPDSRDEKLAIDPPDPQFWDMVKELKEKGWVIAMHGFNHLYTTKDPGLFPIGGKSEFAGLSLSKQDEMIREGKRILKEHGIATDIFMAPSHSFDKNTLTALRKNGFRAITDGFGIRPFKSEGLVFYPISVRRGQSLKDDRDGLVTFVYHVNTMDEKDFIKFKELLSTGKVVSFEENDKMEAKERNIFGDAKQYCLAKSKYMAVQLRKMIK